MTGLVSRRQMLGAGAIAAAGVTTGFAVGNEAAATGRSDAEPTEADIGFCTDMSVHHVQALAMCQRVLGRDTGDAVQAAASEVLQTQGIEVGMMRAWLTDWGAPTTAPETVMAWMGDAFFCGLDDMPGYASDDEMRALSLAEGRERGRMWLELMRAHHVGGVNMAMAATALVQAEKVARLAQTQVDVQTYEIEQYDLLLASEYA